MIPKRRKKPLMGLRESSVIRCQSHLKWVRGCECAIAGKTLNDPSRGLGVYVHQCDGRSEAHHIREGDHGHGMGLKPDDSSAVPLCASAHKRGHDKGWKTFEAEWRVDLSDIASKLWQASPHGQKWRRENER